VAEVAAASGWRRADPRHRARRSDFSGIGLELHVEIDPLPDLADIRAELEGVPTIELGEPIPGPKRLVGKSRLRVGGCASTRWGTASTSSRWATTCGSGQRERGRDCPSALAIGHPRRRELTFCRESALRSRSHGLVVGAPLASMAR
jgi:hypothetical protein